MSKIAVVLPTIRHETLQAFKDAWNTLFKKHNVEFIVVMDGEIPYILHNDERKDLQSDLVFNFHAGVRQLGFLYIAQSLPDVEYIITLDDDCFPMEGDPIQDHIDVLDKRVPVSWFSTASDYMRGFPYLVREEAPVMMSHGVWEGVYDWDAPSQLLKGKNKVEMYKGPIPKGIFFPICGMNLAFRREALPYVYFAPVNKYKGAEHFDDIWMGLEVIKDFAKLNYGIVSGYSTILHLRASNPLFSLEKQAVGIRKNEEYWKGEYDEWYEEFMNKRQKWFELTTRFTDEEIKKSIEILEKSKIPYDKI